MSEAVRRYQWRAVAAVVVICSGRLDAAPPELKSVVPAGATRGVSVDVVIAGTFPAWPLEMWTSGGGVRFEPQKDKGKFRVVVDKDAIPGTRWVRLIGADGASNLRPFIISSSSEVAEKETNDDLARAHDVGAGPIVVNGALAKAGDVDTFRISLKRGRTFVASLDANATLGSPIDAVLQLVDADGHIIDQNHDDRGLDPRIVHDVERDGAYYVRVFAFASDPNSTIRYHGASDAVYRLTLTDGPYVDHVMPVAVPASGSQPLHPSGWNLPATVTFATAMPGIAGEIAGVPLPAGFEGRAGVVGGDIPTVDEQESYDDRPQTVEAPCAVSGHIHRHADATKVDRDIYTLRLEKDSRWRIRILSKSLGFAVDPLLTIEDSAGKQLLRTDDVGRGNSEANATFKAPADGVYRLVVCDLFGSTGPRHVYLLDVRAPDADFSLTTAAAEFRGDKGKPVEFVVAIERPEGMTAEIELTVEGLPIGFGPVKGTSAAKGESAKQVKLQIPTAAKFSGPIRIVGIAKNSAASRRAATAAIDGVPEARTSEIWLTVAPAK